MIGSGLGNMTVICPQVKEAHGNQFHITSLAAANAAGWPSLHTVTTL
jgi:hypothetical protein